MLSVFEYMSWYTCLHLVKEYIARMQTFDDSGPRLTQIVAILIPRFKSTFFIDCGQTRLAPGITCENIWACVSVTFLNRTLLFDTYCDVSLLKVHRLLVK